MAEQTEIQEGTRVSLREALDDLPKDSLEGVTSALYHIREMAEKKEEGPRSLTQDELDERLPQVNKEVKDFLASLTQLQKAQKGKKKELPLADVLDGAKNLLEEAISETERESEFAAAREAAENVSDQAVLRTLWATAPGEFRREAVGNMVRAVTWEIVKDQSGLEDNPFLYILRLYKLGAARVDFYLVGEDPKKLEETVVIDFPLTVDNKKLLGCVSSGDKEVLYGHNWSERCSETKLISPQQERIILELSAVKK